MGNLTYLWSSKWRVDVLVMLTLISFMCTLLWKHYQEEGWANNLADVNCAVAIVSMAISMVSSGGATVKCFPFWRHKVPSFVRGEQPNPLHDAAGSRDYNDLSFFTGTLSQRPFFGPFFEAWFVQLFEQDDNLKLSLCTSYDWRFPHDVHWATRVPGAKNSSSSLLNWTLF